MKGQIYRLAEKSEADILAFKENKDSLSFYAPNLSENLKVKDIDIVRSGIFTNFYPKEEWYLKVMEDYDKNCSLEFSPCGDKAKSLKRIFDLCASHTGAGEVSKEVKNRMGLDGIHYMKEGPLFKGEIVRSFDDSDTAFFLYRVKKLSDSVEGNNLDLGESGKKLVLSMAFLEADMVRCIKRKDTSVLAKRAEDAAGKYLDYYYDDTLTTESKGKLSHTFGNFMKIIFYLCGSNALNDNEFIK